MRHIIDAIAAQGRNGDDELLHVTKGEMAGLESLARKHFGRNLPRNPRTGLKEASLFRDWFGNDVGMAMDIAAPVAVGMIPGVGIPAAVAMGAATGAANQGLGKGGTTEGALMGGVMGGIGAYGGAGMAEGLAGGASAATPTTGGLTGATTPIADAGANLGGTAFTAPAGESTVNIAEAGNLLKPTTTTGLQAPTSSTGTGLKLGTDTAGSTNVLNSATNTSTGGGASLQATAPNGTPVTSMGGDQTATNWDFLKTKEALGPATSIGTSALGTAEMPSGETDTSTGIKTVDKSLPKAEVYYTPYGERRTRIAAAEGGLMSMNGAYGDYDGAEDNQGIRRYNFGGTIKAIQPGGAWGDATANLYSAVDESAPWLKDITPGGAVGQLQPGRRDWEEKKRQEEEAKANEQKANAAAVEKARQDQAFQDKWTQRYGNSVSAAQGGLMGFARGRYLQGAGDGMSDSIPASIDGKQEARLATGEFVVPADVVSHLGNGDSSAGAKQLHSMMDRARMSRTGTKKQGKQINPRKVMPV